MARGSNAKIEVENIIAKAFGDNYIGNIDKKLYVWANDGGERVQIAISLTCPKTFVAGTETSGDYNFGLMSVEAATASAQAAKQPVEITAEETANLEALMKRLGL